MVSVRVRGLRSTLCLVPFTSNTDVYMYVRACVCEIMVDFMQLVVTRAVQG